MIKATLRLPCAPFIPFMSDCLVEVIACDLADAVAAESGGAHRLEVISRYDLGGLTPPVDLVRRITDTVRVPVRVMLRETEDFRVTDPREIATLCEQARIFATLPIDGLVLGFLVGDDIDHALVARILSCAPNLRVTFHRAFESLPDPMQAIAELKQHAQIDCILTRGRGQGWAAEAADFTVWQRAAAPEITMMLGGGTDDEAIKIFRKRKAARAFHAGRAVRADQSLERPVLTDRVRELVELTNERWSERD